ncbi:MAG: NADH-quinone oxidoreductase subunit B, partial [Desulfurococcaceae archaeon]
MEAARAEVRADYRIIRYSPWLVHFNTGACNGCDIEVLASITPLYDP